MSYDVPQRYKPQIEQVAHAEHITVDEAVERIFKAGLERFAPVIPKASGTEDSPGRSYGSFFGVAKGRPGAYGSPEAADRYIEEMRNAW